MISFARIRSDLNYKVCSEVIYEKIKVSFKFFLPKERCEFLTRLQARKVN